MMVLLALHAHAERVNVAKYQPVTASGQNSTYSPDFAVDGIVSNFHSYRTANSNNPHWLEIRYPRAVTMGSAHLYLGLDNDAAQGGLPTFKLQYHDGSAWVDIPGATVTVNTNAERVVVFQSAVTAERIRVYTDENGIRTIREIAVFPPNLSGGVEQGFPIGTDVRLSLAHKRPTAASAIRLDAYPKKVVDGYVDDSSRWLSPATAAGDTLEVDLIIPHAVGSLHLYSGFGSNPVGGMAENFVLESWDGTAWQAIPGGTFAANADPDLVIPINPPIVTSKIRYRTTTANFARVRELLVFPPRANPYPLGQDVEIAPPPAAKWDDYSDSSYRLRCGITDGRFLGFYDDAVRFSAGTLDRSALGWQLLLNYRDGSYRIRHLASGKCLAPSQASAVENDPVILEDYTGMPHQDWFLQAIDATYFRIVNASSGLALQTRFSNWTPGNAMSVRTIDGSNLQRWQTQDSVHYPKKGLAATSSSNLFPNSTQTWLDNSWTVMNGPTHSWSYTWGRQTSGSFPFMPISHSFNPMQWSGNLAHGTNPGPVDYLRRDLNSSAKPIHLMGFNEPDQVEQSNMSVDVSIALWPRLEALDAPLVSPAPASSPGAWMVDFSNKANALGLRRDYTAVHWYASPNAGSLISHLQTAYNTYGKPVWLTEFSAISWTGSGNWTKGDNYNFLAEFLWLAESLPWLKRYSLFQFMEGLVSGTDNPTAPRSNTRKADGSLTAFGELYAGWDAMTSVANEKVYHLHNRDAYRRVQNPAVTDTAAAIDPDTPAAGNQWFLIPGTTENTVRIVSTRDGRRLRFFTGTYVGMAPAANFTGQSEWRLVANQDGWYFLEHPQTNQRLQVSGSGTLVMGSITGNSDAFKWRFVVPAVVNNVAPVLAAIPPQSVVEGNLLTFQASATDADLPANTLAYSLIGAPAGASINPTSGVFTWTPTLAQGPGSFNFTVRVSDGNLFHDQAVSVTVANSLPSATADGDGDGLSDLLEYAFLTDPAIPNGNPFKAVATGTGTITLAFPWNWQASGITWQVRHGSDLSSIPAWPVIAPGNTSVIRDGNVDRIQVTPTMAHPNRGFYVLEIIGN